MADDFDWGGDAPPASPTPDTIIYETHVKGSRSFIRTFPRLRGTYAGLATNRPSIISSAWASRRGTDAGPPPPRRRLSASKGLDNYWAITTLGFFAPTGYSAGGSGPAGPRPGRRVQGHGQSPSRGRARGHPRRGLQPTPPRAAIWVRRSLGAGSTTRPTTGWSQATNSITTTRPAPATHPTPRIRRACADHGFAALLGYGDARRRLPLRLAVALSRDHGGFDRVSHSSTRLQDPVVSRVKLIAGTGDVGSPTATTRPLPRSVE